jgi:hypothetical protein
MQKLVPNNVEFNSVCNEELIHELNIRDISYFQNKKLTQKNNEITQFWGLQ